MEYYYHGNNILCIQPYRVAMIANIQMMTKMMITRKTKLKKGDLFVYLTIPTRL